MDSLLDQEYILSFEPKFTESNDTFTSEKLNLLTACNLSMDIPLTSQNPLPAEAMHLSRILKLNDEELYYFEPENKLFLQPISPHNEMQAIKMLKEVMPKL
jgi:hypothetical protein